MYTIRVDAAKNRLYVTLVGYFSIDEMKTCGDETIQATDQLRPGYDVITDISQFKAGPPEVAKDIERVQAHFRKSGARQGVRIVGENALSGMQFRRTGAQAEYNSVNVPTLVYDACIMVEPRAAASGCTLVDQTPSNLPPLRADPRRIIQTLVYSKHGKEVEENQ